jgi:tetratricopeptide (TPR) repeat protein
MLEAARKYAQKGSKDRALKEYEALLKLDPKDAKLRLELADALRRWGQVDQAAAAYRRVAEQYTAEGFDARAVAVYKQIQSLDPKGYEACEALAELYQRMGLASEAVVSLQAAADGHARDGNKRRALDLLRRMAALEPSNTTSRIKVADLLRQEKMLDEAAAEYEAVCAELEKQGELEPAGRVIERLLELRPDDVSVLCRIARNLLARGLADQAEGPARRASERDPQEIGHHELLAEIYRAQKRDDRLTDTYRRIAELYRLRGDEEHARDILQRFVPMGTFGASPAPAAAAAPFGEEPLDLDERGLDFDDRGLDAGLLRDDLLGDDLLHDEPLAAARPAPSRPVAPASAARPAATPRPSPAPPPRAPARGRSAPAAHDAAEETVFELGAEEGSRIVGDSEQLLAEASVYLRYGKRAQAIENLQAILSREPHHRPALEKLGDAYADGGDRAGAVAAWLRAAELARDDGELETMAVLRDRVAALDAVAAASLEPPEELPLPPEDGPGEEEEEYLDLPESLLGESGRDLGAPDVDAPVAEAPAHEPDGEIEIDLDGVDLGESFDAAPADRAEPPLDDATPIRGLADEPDGIEIDLDLDDEPAAHVEPAASGRATPPEPAGDTDVGEALEEAEFYLQQGLASEARAIFERVLASSPGHPLALVRLGEIAAAAGEDPDAAESTGVEPALEAADESRSGATASPAGPLAELTDPDPSRGWLSADEDPFAADETGDDAPGETGEGAPDDTPTDLASDAGDDASEERLEDSGGVAASEVFDLAAELVAAFGGSASGPSASAPGAGGEDEGLSAIFGAFKRGVQQQLGSGDHEAHYDLGIAYREMGLLDDAIGEFRSAMASPARHIDCLHMLGLCALEQGRADEAIDCLAHALASPDLAQEQELAIRFELGRAYDRAGDAVKARAAWEKVAAVDPSFCEVSEMLAMLDDRAAAPPAAAPAAYESFGDLLAEAEEAPAAPAASAHESFDDLLEEVHADLVEEPPGDERPAAKPPSRPEPPPRAPEREPKDSRTRRRKISFV